MLALRIFPSSPRRGGCAIKKQSRSVLSSRRRGGAQTQQNSAEFDHHPVRSTKEASRYFIEVAATPRRGSKRRGKFCNLHLGNRPLRPWLRSVAALRLNKDAAFTATFLPALSSKSTPTWNHTHRADDGS